MTELSTSVAASALLLTKEPRTRELLEPALTSLAIRAQICKDASSALALLQSRKFEAVIVDLRMGEQAALVLRELRLSPANRTAVSFAITAGDATPPRKPDSMFVLARPLSSTSVAHTLRAAYGLIVRQRRRYFRCEITIPGAIRTQNDIEGVPCRTINLSEGGAAVYCPALLRSSVPHGLRFRLPGHSSRLYAETTLRWRSGGSIVGLEFRAFSGPQRAELQEWLARKLEETLPERVAGLFRDLHPSP